MKQKNKWLTLILPAILCAALWGSAAPCVKLGYAFFEIPMDETFSKLVFAGWRFSFAGLITLVYSFFAGFKPLLPNKNNIKAILVIGLFQSMIQYVCYYIGLSNTTATNAALLSGTQTFFAIIFAHLLLSDDKLTKNKALGCILGFSGVIFLQLGNSFSAFQFSGDGLLLLSAASAGMGALVSRVLAKGHNAVILTAWQLIFGGVFLLSVGYIGGGSLHHIAPKGILLLVYLMFLSAIAFSVWTVLLKKHPVSKVSVFNFLIPVFGAVFSAILLGEKLLTFKNLIALGLVGTGIIIANKNGTQKE